MVYAQCVFNHDEFGINGYPNRLLINREIIDTIQSVFEWHRKFIKCLAKTLIAIKMIQNGMQSIKYGFKR